MPSTASFAAYDHDPLSLTVSPIMASVVFDDYSTYFSRRNTTMLAQTSPSSPIPFSMHDNNTTTIPSDTEDDPLIGSNASLQALSEERLHHLRRRVRTYHPDETNAVELARSTGYARELVRARDSRRTRSRDIHHRDAPLQSPGTPPQPPLHAESFFAFLSQNYHCNSERSNCIEKLCDSYYRTPLKFKVVFDDGGQYSSLYGVENILRNDESVYCSERHGPVNILLGFCGDNESMVDMDKSCVISQILIQSPQHGFTAPCKEGLVFVSHHPIDISDTERFDDFTKEDYEEYISTHKDDGSDDVYPSAWFTISDDNQVIVDLNSRSGRFVLFKLLRANDSADNIDIQYIGLIGYSGPRAFGSARLI
ncbi:uncharacterized protein BYT42DRAFT_572132 [Radiomyces spectabilis]|uniref:uncharacterized protein n=1 Tax=Radiomyces spectabilis TaxID=64574 RepID=UPI00221F40DF|nr:uncharacterized protein BYT42DRAFT_572132 [Radiomyces spectabilis]KAI8377907.1 hypothetical protein BYT42DRAFT_572132 [Radiomyces spectabilis]